MADYTEDDETLMQVPSSSGAKLPWILLAVTLALAVVFGVLMSSAASSARAEALSSGTEAEMAKSKLANVQATATQLHERMASLEKERNDLLATNQTLTRTLESGKDKAAPDPASSNSKKGKKPKIIKPHRRHR